MIEAATIVFRDADSGDEALIGIRYNSKHIALFLSLRSNGDVQVVMTKDEAKQIVEALKKIID